MRIPSPSTATVSPLTLNSDTLPSLQTRLGGRVLDDHAPHGVLGTSCVHPLPQQQHPHLPAHHRDITAFRVPFTAANTTHYSNKLNTLSFFLKSRRNSLRGRVQTSAPSSHSTLSFPRPAPNPAVGIKAHYFNGENASAPPIVFTVLTLFGLGYTIDYQSELP